MSPIQKLYEPYLFDGNKCNHPITGEIGYVNLTTGQFVSETDILSFSEFFLLRENLNQTELRYRLGDGRPKGKDDYQNSNPFGPLCSMYCSLRGISPQVGLEAGLRETENSVLFPYFDVHRNLIGVTVRDAYTGKFSTSPVNYPYMVYKDRIIFDTVVWVKGESDTLRLKTALEQEELNLPQNSIGVYGLPFNQFSREFLRETISSNRIVVLPQTNLDGLKLINSLKGISPLPSVVELPWISGQKGKDFSDWISYSDNNFDYLLSLIKPPKTERKIYSDVDLMGLKMTDKHYIIDNLLATQQIAFLSGPQKARKTFMLLNMLKAIQEGSDLFGIPGFKGNPKTKVLIIEAEGNSYDLKVRRDKILGKNPNGNFFWIHGEIIKFDEETDVTWLIQEIKSRDIDLVILDPFQEFHSSPDENNAGLMTPFWNGIKRCKLECKCAFLIVHHFSKDAQVGSLWNSMRGSSKNAGTADLGLFTQKHDTKTSRTNKLTIDGREYTGNYFGSDSWFTLEFSDCLFSIVEKRPKELSLDFLTGWGAKEFWLLEDCAKYFNVTPRTIQNRITNDEELNKQFTFTKPSPNNPVKIMRRNQE